MDLLVKHPARVYGFLFAYRLFWALSAVTFFQPDEYWQSLEIAHSIVFGYGFKTWEWLHSPPIRSPLFPLIYVPGYFVLRLLGLDNYEFALINTPKTTQALISATIDYSTFKLASRLPGISNQWSLLCSLISFFNAFVSVRTFSNSAETALTVLALSYWPLPSDNNPGSSSLSVSLFLAALAIIIRPSNVIIWLPMGLYLVYQSLNNVKNIPSFSKILKTVGAQCLLGSLICFLLDSFFYGKPTFTPFNFLYANIGQNIASFYGSNVWHFYLSQGLPFTLLTLTPFVLDGLIKTRRQSSLLSLSSWSHQFLSTFAFTIFAFSLIDHKEFRFIQPILPIAHIFASHSISSIPLFNKNNKIKNKKSRVINIPFSIPILFLTLSNLIPAWYFNQYHCHGQVDIMHQLGSTISASASNKYTVAESIAFLMPCHSTPWQSHLHQKQFEGPAGQASGRGGKLWFITCDPPVFLNNNDKSTYLDQSDIFYNDPLLYLENYFPPTVDPNFPPSPNPPILFNPRSQSQSFHHEWPSHIVVFEALFKYQPEVQSFLESKGYSIVKSIWNSHWHDDPRRRGHLLILAWNR